MAFSVLAPNGAPAQGVTSAAVQGIVTREGGTPVEAAIVWLTNSATGVRQTTSTRTNGRYNLENVPPGGPYTIEVRAIGFERATKSGVTLTLGQRYTSDFELKAQVVTLEEISVIASTNPLINTGRTGAAQILSDTTMGRLPLLGRNFTSLLNINPQVATTSGGGITIAGQNNRFNNIQIDGGINNDVFGLAASGTPGGQAGAKPISLEALQEFQVLTAPFDVRQGNFSGGLVNAVTKSGTNKLSGSVFGSFQRQDLVGLDTAGTRLANFQVKAFGFSLGGPIIKNRMHFFVTGDIQDRNQPFTGNESTIPATGITTSTAERVAGIIRSKYGFDPGGSESPVIERPDNNFFGKLTYQLSNNHFAELSHNYVNAGDDNFGRTSRTRTDRDGWQLSNSGYRFESKTNSTRLKLTSTLGSSSNEFLVSYQTVRDQRAVPNRVPLLLIQGDVAGNYIAAGAEKFSHANSLDQNILEITDNFTFGVGNHQFTVGTHNEFFSFRNVFFPGSLGVWTFASADALDAGTPNRYELSFGTAARPEGPIADWGVKQLGGYLQDRWNLSDRVALTFGVRVDVPLHDAPVANAAFTAAFPGLRTDDFPSGNLAIAPRFGFNWDVWGSGETILRGGVGIFAGRPPYVWLSNAFTNTGQEQFTLVCTGNLVPTFTLDVGNLPRTCLNTPPGTPPAQTINVFDPDFKAQQSLRYAFGIDHQFGSGIVGTLDVIHTRNRHTMYVNNIKRIETNANAEGRMLYIADPAPARAAFATVVTHENRSKDRSWLVTGQLQKRFSDGVEFNAAYTWQKSEDLFSLTSSIATSNLNFTSLDGTLANRNLATSGFETRHKIILSGTVNLPFGLAGSMIYRGQSGLPFAYTYNGDANGDGIVGNDLLYVPKDPTDISLVAAADYAVLDQFIAGQDCLRSQRGQVMRRNSCRNPWISFVDVRLSKFINVPGGNRMQVGADIFNFLNMLDADWGLQRETSAFEELNFLRVAGTDNRGTTGTTADDRGLYDLPKSGSNIILPRIRPVQTFGSRWRVQLGAKYVF
ncbi:MAG: TonB-dependent receptor domain-containing protein [Gemmatimonadales bacterium]